MVFDDFSISNLIFIFLEAEYLPQDTYSIQKINTPVLR